MSGTPQLHTRGVVERGQEEWGPFAFAKVESIGFGRKLQEKIILKPQSSMCVCMCVCAGGMVSMQSKDGRHQCEWGCFFVVASGGWYRHIIINISHHHQTGLGFVVCVCFRCLCLAGFPLHLYTTLWAIECELIEVFGEGKLTD